MRHRLAWVVKAALVVVVAYFALVVVWAVFKTLTTGCPLAQALSGLC
jgi:hypothetical protein